MIYIKKGILVFAALILGVFLLEVGVRFLYPQELIVYPEKLWTSNEKQGWRHQKNIREVVNTGERNVIFKSNEFGYRISDIFLKSSIKLSKNILFLGDSFIEALQVEHEESVSSLVEKGINADTPIKVNILNSGVSGWNPNQYRMEVERFDKSDNISLVVTFLYMGNDLVDKSFEAVRPTEFGKKGKFSWPSSWTRTGLTHSLFDPLNKILEEKSQLYILLRWKLRGALIRFGLSKIHIPEYFFKNEKNVKYWNTTARICKEISAHASEIGAKSIFIFIPTDFQVIPSRFDEIAKLSGINKEDFQTMMPNEKLKLEFKNNGLLFFDPTTPLIKLKKNDWYGKRDRHLSPSGHKKLAELITPSIINLIQ